MKLKKSFLAKTNLIIAACGAIAAFTGCSTTARLIPGSKQIEISNIYVEYLNIADLYYSEEKWDKAVTYYSYALGNKDIYWEAYYKLAKTYAIQKNWTKAEECYKVIYKRDPENASIKATLAYIKAMSGDTKQAKKLYLELIETQEYNQEYYEDYLSILIMEGNYEEAKAEYDKIAELFPDSKNLEKFEKAINELNPEKTSEEEQKEKPEEDGKEPPEDGKEPPEDKKTTKD